MLAPRPSGPPSPSRPSPLYPHACSCSPATSRLCMPPPHTSRAWLPTRVSTRLGNVWLVTSPWPSRPAPPCPQESTAPLASIQSECDPPALTWSGLRFGLRVKIRVRVSVQAPRAHVVWDWVRARVRTMARVSIGECEPPRAHRTKAHARWQAVEARGRRARRPVAHTELAIAVVAACVQLALGREHEAVLRAARELRHAHAWHQCGIRHQ